VRSGALSEMKGQSAPLRKQRITRFIDGYFVDNANVATPDVNKTDETFHVFGKDSPESDVLNNYGTLTLGLLDKYTSNAILDLITGQDPGDTAPHRYQADDLGTVHVWANIKDAKNTQYLKSWFLGGWAPGLPMPSGNPEAKAAVSIVGNGHLPEQYQGCFVMMKKVSSGAAVSMGVTPIPVPTGSLSGNPPEKYAISVKAINDTTASPGGKFDQEEVTVTAAMVTSAGTVVFSEIMSQTTLPAVTHAAVYYLSSGTGVYPTASAKPDKLRT